MSTAAAAKPVALRLAGDAARFRRRLERMGPTFVKLGQFLALRPDLVPEDYSRELMQLHDRVAAFPWPVAKEIIEDDLGAPVERLFESIGPVPIGAGSLAQSHYARLPNGQEVVVKVRRPNVEAQIDRDLKRADRIARLLESSGLSLVVGPKALVEEVGWWLRQELDMRNELRNLRRLRKLAHGSPYERVPRPYPRFCGERVLTSEYLRGIPLSELLGSIRSGQPRELERVRRLGIDRETLATSVVAAVLRQIFVYQFFHADVHPGNLLALPGGRIGFVDFGLCDQLDDGVRKGQLEGLSAAYYGDVDDMFDALVKILEPTDETDLAAFRRDFAAHTKTWLSRIQIAAKDPAAQTTEPRGLKLLGLESPDEAEGPKSEELAGSPIGQWMLGAVHTAREHRMQLPPRVLSMYRTLLTAESVASQLGSSTDIRSVGKNFFLRLRIEEEIRSIGPERWQAAGSDMLALLRDGPRNLHRLLDDASHGRLNVNVTVTEAPVAARSRRERTRLVVAAVVALTLATLLASAGVRSSAPLTHVLTVAFVLTFVLTVVKYRRLA